MYIFGFIVCGIIVAKYLVYEYINSRKVKGGRFFYKEKLKRKKK